MNRTIVGAATWGMLPQRKDRQAELFQEKMVTLSPSEARSRQATIEAACRVAMRMVRTGRGSAAALQFLLDVAARHVGLPMAIIGTESGEPLVICNDKSVKGRWPVPRGPGRIAGIWSVSLRRPRGTTLGELLVRPSVEDELDGASSKALETVARTAAEIMAQERPRHPEGQSR